MPERVSHTMFQLAVTLEQSAQLGRLTELTKCITVESAVFIQSNTGVLNKARNSRALFGLQGFFFF